MVPRSREFKRYSRASHGTSLKSILRMSRRSSTPDVSTSGRYTSAGKVDEATSACSSLDGSSSDMAMVRPKKRKHKSSWRSKGPHKSQVTCTTVRWAEIEKIRRHDGRVSTESESVGCSLLPRLHRNSDSGGSPSKNRTLYFCEIRGYARRKRSMQARARLV